MGAKLIELTQQSFGVAGNKFTRPLPWPRLSPKYAKRVGRAVATLDTDIGKSPYSKGRPTGRLFRSARLSASEEKATVSYEEDYASYHQFGTDKMPARPFMPIGGNGKLTPFAEKTIIRAAQRELELIIGRKSGPNIY